MKLHLKPIVAGAAALAIVGAGLAIASPANAVSIPWNPDPQSNGRIVFYDAAGNVITGGSNLAHIADYVAADGPKEATNATKAQLYFATPKNGVLTANWATASASTATTFPNTSAPAPISGNAATNGNGQAFTNPLISILPTDANLLAYTQSYPNTESTTGYPNIYQVRLVNTGPGFSADGTWWEADIAVNTTSSPITVDGNTVAANSWLELDPTVATTTTSISATPTSPQTVGASVTLNSTVTPAENGTVQFFDGTTAVGTPQAVTTTSGAASVSAGTPALGAHSYTAVFTPTGGTQVQGSTSAALPYTITPVLINTSTALSVPASAALYSSVALTADVSEADAPATAGLAGSVQFFSNGTTSLGTVSTNDGTAGEYKLTIPSITLPVSGTPYQITAVFTPTSNLYAGSTSAAEPLTVTAPTCEGTPVTGASCTDTQNIEATVVPGSITVTTPYTPSHPYNVGDLTLNAGGTLLSAAGRFPASGDPDITVTSTLAGDPNWTLSVTDTDLTSGSNTINGENLGLTAGGIDNPTGGGITPAFPTTVGFTNIPAANGTTAGGTGLGLKGGPHTFAQTTGGGNGTAQLFGTLTLNAPPQTVAGTYAGTITFSVA